MNEEIKIIIKAITGEAKKAVKEVSKELDGLSKSAKGSSGTVGAAFKGIAKGAAIAVSAVAAIGTALVLVGKHSIQFQKEQARLNAAFLAAGASAEQAAAAYQGLYRFLGDSGKASEAAAHLAKITTNQKHLAEWTKISQGVYATFGDSLPIEGLTEAANETLRVGKVTGTLADALNWAGVSEDEFNAKLAQTNSLSEREALLRSTLNGLYSDAADIYEKNNQALLDYNESQARVDSAMASAGQAIMPLLTALNNLGTAFFNALKPALDAIIPPIATFINWIAKAIQSVLSFFSALTGKSTSIKAVASNMGSAANSAKSLGSGMAGAQKAAEGAAAAAEEVKKTTQGFDELNIVSSGASSGGGSGSGSPAYGAGGSGLIDNAVFGTEVEESEGLANSLAESIKETFGQLAEVFAPSIGAWSDAFETVKQAWNNAKPDFINGATEIKAGFETLGTYLFGEFVPNFVNTFSVNIAPIIGDTLGFAIEEAGAAFEWFGGKVNVVINDIVVPALQSIETVFTDVFTIIGEGWEEHGAPLLEGFSTAFAGIRTALDDLYYNCIEPIWSAVIAKFDEVWTNALEPLVSNFVDSALEIGECLLQLYNDFIYPVVSWILNKIYPIIVDTIEGIIDYVGDIVGAISQVISGVIDILEGLVQFITGVFTGDWELAWEGVKNIFRGIWDAVCGLASAAWRTIQQIFSPIVQFFSGIWSRISGVFSKLGTNIANAISGAVKSGINGVISIIERTINSAIRLINGAIKLVNKIPGVNVSTIKTLSLPRLAKGGVVDSATIAMIGEQGKEAVVPLENNTEWIDILVNKLAARQNTPSKVILKVGEKELGWATIGAINGITEQTGGLQLVL